MNRNLIFASVAVVGIAAGVAVGQQRDYGGTFKLAIPVAATTPPIAAAPAAPVAQAAVSDANAGSDVPTSIAGALDWSASAGQSVGISLISREQVISGKVIAIDAERDTVAVSAADAVYLLRLSQINFVQIGGTAATTTEWAHTATAPVTTPATATSTASTPTEEPTAPPTRKRIRKGAASIATPPAETKPPVESNFTD